MHFDNNYLRQLRDKVQVSEIISRKVRLIKKGKEFIGLCPFHHEKTPSFSVNDEKNFYHCFGCGAHGDAVTFLVNAEGMDFKDSVIKLAAEVGMSLPTDNSFSAKQIAHDKRIYEVLEIATNFYQSQLENHSDAAKYIHSRKISNEILKKFKVGFAPNNKNLLQNLLDKNFSEEELIESGIFQRKGSNLIPWFWKRIIFPIQDINGKVIGFGGRNLDQALPKYLNSPETSLFHKRSTVYGLNHARNASFKSGNIYITEGYMDAISMHNHGFTNTVATLGTAVSEEHLKILWKISDEPIFCMDGDVAGIKGMVRVSEIALKMLKPGKSVNFVRMPIGMDPDDILKERGAEGLELVLKEKVSLSELIWQRKLEEILIKDTPEKRAQMEYEMNKLVDDIHDSAVKKFYKSFFSNKLWEQFRYKNSNNKPFSISTNSLNIKLNNLSEIEKYELILLLLIQKSPEILKEDNVREFLITYEPRLTVLSTIFSQIYHSYNEKEVLGLNEINNIIMENYGKVDVDVFFEKHIYFLDKSKGSSYTEPSYKWLQVRDLMHLEFLKEDYKKALKKMDNASFDKALSLKEEILKLENIIKTKYYQ